MATTTNFGWETPDDTDLVKDGAAAIRTALGGVDTSFIDLKGGTTGQILSKASNTDLDYTWVTTDDANAIQNAIVDAKGDLITATAADTPARLAVGTNGQILVADSSTSTGLKWATPTAGGTVNWTAVNSGGTSLSGSSLTISSISGANYLLMTWLAASSDAINGEFEIQINGDTAANYYYGGTYVASGTSDWNGSGTSGTTRIRIGALPAINSDGYGYCLISGANASGVKAFESSMGSNRTGNFSSSVGGWWNNTATISSVTVKLTAGNFDGGVLHVFKSA